MIYMCIYIKDGLIVQTLAEWLGDETRHLWWDSAQTGGPYMCTALSGKSLHQAVLVMYARLLDRISGLKHGCCPTKSTAPQNPEQPGLL